MAVKPTNFTREGAPFDVFQIGKNYTEGRQQILLILEQIYEDYKKEGVIYSLTKYENKIMSMTYLNKLAELGIVKRLPDRNGNIQYEWNGGDNPDFTDLTNRILAGSKF